MDIVAITISVVLIADCGLRRPRWSLSVTTTTSFRPTRPEDMDWSTIYPGLVPATGSGEAGPRVEFLDVGCGYGGMVGKSQIQSRSSCSCSFAISFS